MSFQAEVKGKKYFSVMELRSKPQTSVPIENCSAILESRVQCQRPGDILVEDGEKRYQLCMRHAVIQQHVDQGDMESLAPQPYPLMTEPQAEYLPEPELGHPEISAQVKGAVQRDIEELGDTAKYQGAYQKLTQQKPEAKPQELKEREEKQDKAAKQEMEKQQKDASKSPAPSETTMPRERQSESKTQGSHPIQPPLGTQGQTPGVAKQVTNQPQIQTKPQVPSSEPKTEKKPEEHKH